jgi:hypothetical protein
MRSCRVDCCLAPVSLAGEDCRFLRRCLRPSELWLALAVSARPGCRSVRSLSRPHRSRRAPRPSGPSWRDPETRRRHQRRAPNEPLIHVLSLSPGHWWASGNESLASGSSGSSAARPNPRQCRTCPPSSCCTPAAPRSRGSAPHPPLPTRSGTATPALASSADAEPTAPTPPAPQH